MQLPNHPLMSYRGLRSWPPTWSLANPQNDLKPLRGEIGRLKYILPDQLSKKCFLIIEHDDHPYVGCLFFDDSIFCAQMIINKIIESQAGFTIKEIGDLDLSLARFSGAFSEALIAIESNSSPQRISPFTKSNKEQRKKSNCRNRIATKQEISGSKP